MPPATSARTDVAPPPLSLFGGGGGPCAGASAAHYFSSMHREDIAKVRRALAKLLAGTDCVDHRDAYGETPLMEVCGGASAAPPRDEDTLRVRMTQALLMLGADAAVRRKDGNTALHLAVRAGLRRIVGVLLLSGADPTVANSHGSTPLHYAAVAPHATHVLASLVRGGRCVDVDAADATGSTPLHLAAEMGRADAARLLLAVGADAAVRNRLGKTPEDLAWGQTRGVFESRADGGLVAAAACG